MPTTYPRDSREVSESPITQGVNESRAYSFDFTGCGVTSVEDQSVAVYELLPLGALGDDVTSTVMPGDPTVDTLVLTTPKLGNLEAGKVYQMYGRVIHDGGQQTELICRVFARA